MVFVVQERALVNVTRFIGRDTRAADFAVYPLAIILEPGWHNDLAISVAIPVFEITFIDRSISIGCLAFALPLTFDPVTIIDVAVGEGQGAFAVIFGVLKLPFVNGAVGVS